MKEVTTRLIDHGLLGQGDPVGRGGQAPNFSLPALNELVKAGTRMAINPTATFNRLTTVTQPIIQQPLIGRSTPAPSSSLFSQPSTSVPAHLARVNPAYLGGGGSIGSGGLPMDFSMPMLKSITTTSRLPINNTASFNRVVQPSFGGAGFGSTSQMGLLAPSQTQTVLPPNVRMIPLPLATPERMMDVTSLTSTPTPFIRLPTHNINILSSRPDVSVSSGVQTQINPAMLNVLQQIDLSRLKEGRAKGAYKATEIKDKLKQLGVTGFGTKSKAELVAMLRNKYNEIMRITTK